MPPCPAIIFRGPRVPNEAERLELGFLPTVSTSYPIRLQRDANSAVTTGEGLQTGNASSNEYIKIEDGIPTQDLTRDNGLLAVISELITRT